MKLTAKQEAFALKYAECGKISESYRYAYDSENMKPHTINVKASELLRNGKVAGRVAELESIKKKVADIKFTITLEQRLKWLKEIAEAGLESIEDLSGISRRQNLAASNSAVVTLNTMLGVDEEGGKVKPVKVVIGVKDASRP